MSTLELIANAGAPDPASLSITEGDTSLFSSAYNAVNDEYNRVYKAYTDMHNAGYTDAESVHKLDELGDKLTTLGIAKKAEIRAARLAKLHSEFQEQDERLAYKASEATTASEPDAEEDIAYKAFYNYARTGQLPPVDSEAYKALSVDGASGAEGGYTITPTVVDARIEAELQNMMFMERLATKHYVQPGQNYWVPLLSSDFARAQWVTENNAGTADTMGTFDRVEINPQRLVVSILQSNDVINNPETTVVPFTDNRLVYKYGETKEIAYLLATADANGGLGLFTPNAAGISTARDVDSSTATATTTGRVTFDAVMDTVYGITKAYRMRPNVRWVVHRDAIRELRKIRGSDGHPIWVDGLGVTPSTLMGFVVEESEYAPGPSGTGNNAGEWQNNDYFAVFGDLSNYHIVEARPMRYIRSEHRYVEVDRTYVAFRGQLGGKPVIEEAFRRIQIDIT